MEGSKIRKRLHEILHGGWKRGRFHSLSLRMRRIATFYILLSMASCGSPGNSDSSENTENKSSSKVIIYQMMTRLFGNTIQTNKPYGTLEENGVGKFSDITDKALIELKQLGATHIWYTGVIEHAVLTDYTQFGIPLDDADVVKGRAGSPYAIKDYYDVNPDLADDVENRMAEFESLIQRTHNNGLKVIIDFVPNHVARAYHSDAKPDGVADLGANDDNSVRFKPSNNFYYLPGESFIVPSGYQALGADNTFPTKDGKFEETPAKVTGNDQFTSSPGVNEWFETIKLNYGVDIEGGRKTYFDPIPDTWTKMKEILVFWAEKGVDGFRCDMAEMVPVEFWSWVIPHVKKINPEIIFVAEIYNPQAYRAYISQGGFDFLYDKVQLYDTLRLLVNGKSSTKDIAAIQKSLEGINNSMVHFLENHDEQRVASRFFAGDPWKAIPAMVISALIDRGPVMIYFGQEVGEPGLGSEGFQGDDGRTTIYDYWGVPEHQKWMNNGQFDGGQLTPDQRELRSTYKKILSIARNNPVVVKGDFRDLAEFNMERGNFDDQVYAFIRSYNGEYIIVVTSFKPAPSNIRIDWPDDISSIFDSGKLTAVDLMDSGKEISLPKSGIELELPPFAYYVFKVNS